MADATQERTSDVVPVGRGIAVQPSRHGRGVFATRRFAEGEAVETCPTLELPASEVVGHLSDYVFGTGDDNSVLLILGFGMLYNHSAEPNVEYLQDEDRTITFVTTRAVKPGEELRIDYGEEWWETRGLQPE